MCLIAHHGGVASWVGAAAPSWRWRLGGFCALAILGMGGKDLFGEEVERRVRSEFECRTEEQVAEYYSAAVRGADDSRSRGR